jgi:hypothetical protein
MASRTHRKRVEADASSAQKQRDFRAAEAAVLSPRLRRRS